MCSVALIIGEDVKIVGLRGVGVLVFFLLGKGDSSLASLKSCLVWEFPLVVEHEDVWNNKAGFGNPPT